MLGLVQRESALIYGHREDLMVERPWPRRSHWGSRAVCAWGVQVRRTTGWSAKAPCSRKTRRALLLLRWPLFQMRPPLRSLPFHARFVLFEGSSVGFLAAPLGSNEDLSALGGVVVRDPECPGHDGGRPRQDQDPIEPASHDSFLEDQIQEALPLPRRQLSEPTCGTAWRGSPPYQPLAFGPGKDPARRVDSGFALRLHALLTRP
jgi:hypothetical protein